MIAGLYNLPENEIDLNRWSFFNQDLHHVINIRILQQYGIAIGDVVLDPIPVQDLGSWSYRHQLIHNAQNAVLGIMGNDLTFFNPNDRQEFASWIWLHGQEMFQACRKLGIA